MAVNFAFDVLSAVKRHAAILPVNSHPVVVCSSRDVVIALVMSPIDRENTAHFFIFVDL